MPAYGQISAAYLSQFQPSPHKKVGLPGNSLCHTSYSLCELQGARIEQKYPRVYHSKSKMCCLKSKSLKCASKSADGFIPGLTFF